MSPHAHIGTTTTESVPSLELVQTVAGADTCLTSYLVPPFPFRGAKVSTTNQLDDLQLLATVTAQQQRVL